jgi:PAS domain S-box-containing protein
MIKEEAGKVERDTADIAEKELTEYWLKLETLVSTISSRFLGKTPIDDALKASLRDIGVLSGVSRSFIFQFSKDMRVVNNTHEWCAESISPRVHKLQGLESKRFPWWMQQLKEGKIIHITDIEYLPNNAQATKDFLELQNIKSVLIFPLYVKSILRGYLGFESVKKQRKWKNSDFSLLRLISQIIGNALERYEVEEVIKTSEERHRLILDNINELVFIIDEDLIIEYINEESLSKLLGYQYIDILDRSLLDYIHNEDEEIILRNFQTNSKSRESIIELRFKNINEDWIWFECQGRNFIDRDEKDKWLIVARDISERKVIEERYKNLFESSPNAILLIDLEGKIIDCNSTTAKIFGYGKEFFIGKSYNDLNSLFHLDIRHYFKKIFQASFTQSFPEPIESEMIINNVNSNWVKIQASVIKQHGKTLMQLIFQDITEKRKVELFEATFMEELEEKVKIRTKELNNALEQQKLLFDQIVKTSQFKTEFMATMSHELRTPLNAIIGFADLLLEGVYGELTNEQNDFILDIKSSAEHQFDMIQHILDISKIESGQVSLNIQKFSLNSLIDQISSSLRPLYSKKKLKFIVKGLEEEILMYADPIRLKEIILNLLSNAIKFTIEGYVKLQIKQNYYDWIFKVIDTGIGIARSDYSLIFKEFKRVDSPYVRSISGTGLGLSLSKRLIELHGGEINFTSSLGTGTIFTFNIPKKLEEKSNNAKF